MEGGWVAQLGAPDEEAQQAQQEVDTENGNDGAAAWGGVVEQTAEQATTVLVVPKARQPAAEKPAAPAGKRIKEAISYDMLNMARSRSL